MPTPVSDDVLRPVLDVIHRWQALADFFRTSTDPMNKAAAGLITEVLSEIRAALPSPVNRS